MRSCSLPTHPHRCPVFSICRISVAFARRIAAWRGGSLPRVTPSFWSIPSIERAVLRSSTFRERQIRHGRCSEWRNSWLRLLLKRSKKTVPLTSTSLRHNPPCDQGPSGLWATASPEGLPCVPLLRGRLWWLRQLHFMVEGSTRLAIQPVRILFCRKLVRGFILAMPFRIRA